MNQRLYAVAVVGLLVVGVAVFAGLVSLSGDDTAPGDDATPSGGATDPSATATPVAGASGTDSGSGTDGTGGDDGTDGDTVSETATAAPEDPFAFDVKNVEECGRTCRDVTTTLTNERSTNASNVTVTTHIYAGNGTSGDPVWTGEESVGTLPAGDSYTTTERVELGMSDVLAVEQNDGWITIETTIESDDATMTVVQRRDVA